MELEEEGHTRTTAPGGAIQTCRRKLVKNCGIELNFPWLSLWYYDQLMYVH